VSDFPAAVFWDLDGTLVETEPYWIEAEARLVAEHGGVWTHEDAMKLVGNDLLESARYIRERGEVDLEPEAIVDLLLDEVVERVRHDVPWRPGARELLTDLRIHGVPCGLVTMSYRRFVQPVLDALPHGTFDAVVTGESVTRGKPDPEPYLAAARVLGVAAADTVAIEDSSIGAASAAAAGCRVLVVPNHVPVEPGAGLAFSATLAGVSAPDLVALTRPGRV
jgi:HAD superfamily hydrolase (TIGR01509 family)